MRQLKEGSSRLGDTINQDKRIWNILFLPPTSIPFSATRASVLALTVCSCESVQLTNVEKNKLREKNTIIQKTKQKPSNHQIIFCCLSVFREPHECQGGNVATLLAWGKERDKRSTGKDQVSLLSTAVRPYNSSVAHEDVLEVCLKVGSFAKYHVTKNRDKDFISLTGLGLGVFFACLLFFFLSSHLHFRSVHFPFHYLAFSCTKGPCSTAGQNNKHKEAVSARLTVVPPL